MDDKFDEEPEFITLAAINSKSLSSFNSRSVKSESYSSFALSIDFIFKVNWMFFSRRSKVSSSSCLILLIHAKGEEIIENLSLNFPLIKRVFGLSFFKRIVIEQKTKNRKIK